MWPSSHELHDSPLHEGDDLHARVVAAADREEAVPELVLRVPRAVHEAARGEIPAGDVRRLFVFKLQGRSIRANVRVELKGVRWS
jgi:hypothetical protein